MCHFRGSVGSPVLHAMSPAGDKQGNIPHKHALPSCMSCICLTQLHAKRDRVSSTTRILAVNPAMHRHAGSSVVHCKQQQRNPSSCSLTLESTGTPGTFGLSKAAELHVSVRVSICLSDTSGAAASSRPCLHLHVIIMSNCTISITRLRCLACAE